MGEIAHVILFDDYYTHEYFRDASQVHLSDYDKNHLYEIPVETLVRWEDAEAAWLNAQEEMRELMKRRGVDRNFARPALPSPGLPF